VEYDSLGWDVVGLVVRDLGGGYNWKFANLISTQTPGVTERRMPQSKDALDVKLHSVLDTQYEAVSFFRVAEHHVPRFDEIFEIKLRLIMIIQSRKIAKVSITDTVLLLSQQFSVNNPFTA